MKKILLLFVFAISVLFANAQSDSTVKRDGRNLFKINLTALPLKTYSVEYERAIGKKTAFGLGVKYFPKGKLPFLSQIKDLIDDEETNKQLDGFEMSNFAFTPEIKFYFGKDVFRGFYIAPFARYSIYKATVPIIYDGDNGDETIPLSGDITTLTGGLLFGAEWKLSKHIYLDWSIIGPHVGTSKGDIDGKKDLSDPDEKQAVTDALQDLKDSDIPLLDIDYKVNDDGAKVNFSGPWAGIRAAISIGVRF